MINLFMPTGLKGVMVASMLAAFMSTIDTHLNWGTSYIVNDFYKPFIDNEKSTRFYIALSRLLMLALTIIALLITTKLSSILSAYKYLSVMFGGIATVMIARWYWWRVNPYSEISAIITSLIVANFLQIKLQSGPAMDLYAVRLVITVVVVTSVWITVTFLTSSKKPDEHMIRFYSKMKIPGPGWKKLRDTAGVGPYPDELKQSVMGWLSCIVFLYSLMIGIGKLLFHQWIAAFMCMVLAAISGLILKKILSKMRFL
jgi:SSS family solute:Na+ symporter